MFNVGLCSVTFRKLTPEEVIEAAKKADIDGIEWGGDYHVPPLEFERAKKVAVLTEEAGLEITSYGSYYRLGYETDSFEGILETALKLKAPAIRVWAGKLGSDEATEYDWRAVVEDAKRIAQLASEKGVQINLEYHGRTLTDTAESTTRLMREINHQNVYLYWQPALFETVKERLASIDKVKPWLTHVHVFHWETTKNSRIVYPLAEGVPDWEQYISKLRKDDGIRYLMLEFVKGDSVEQFLEDVQTLKGLMK